MSVYASDPDARPDADFEPGTLSHLVPGARGRLLDPRRTPVSVVEVWSSVGFVHIRIEAFEDEGATWEVPLERTGDFQFERGGLRASDADIAEMEATIGRVAHDQVIEADAAERERTNARIAERQADAGRWLSAHSRFLASGEALPDPAARRGDPTLADDLEVYLRETDLWEIEEPFARVFVSNPGSGEIVKAHRIVLAELGLADYAGAIVRDPGTFAGAWSHERRAEHILARLAFVRALFELLGVREALLWRGLSFEGRRQPRPGRTFVSTSFDEAVARSHYESGSVTWTHVLTRRAVPVERLFMTYLETGAMNTVFLEAEAVVLDHHADRWP